MAVAMRTTHLVVPLLGLALAGCGGETATTPPPPVTDSDVAPPPPGSQPEGQRATGELVLTVDGRAIRTAGRVKSSSFTPAAGTISQTIKGPVAGMDSTMLEPRDLWFIILVDAVEPGTWELVPYDNLVRDREGTQAWVEIGASAGVELPTLTPKDGDLTLTAVEIGDQGTARATRLVGSFSGTFRGGDGDDHQVTGRFDFTH